MILVAIMRVIGGSAVLGSYLHNRTIMDCVEGLEVEPDSVTDSAGNSYSRITDEEGGRSIAWPDADPDRTIVYSTFQREAPETITLTFRNRAPIVLGCIDEYLPSRIVTSE